LFLLLLLLLLSRALPMLLLVLGFRLAGALSVEVVPCARFSADSVSRCSSSIFCSIMDRSVFLAM
jgi:hypothetical protein